MKTIRNCRPERVSRVPAMNPYTLPERRYRSFRPTLGREAHSGFTLVELLVVIAIIGVLVALLLPAVQAAREAARRSSCLNNLSQLALAVHNYEFAVENLPAGTINPDGPIRSEPIGQHVSWLVQILPYVEMRNVYDAFDQQAGATRPRTAPFGPFRCRCSCARPTRVRNSMKTRTRQSPHTLVAITTVKRRSTLTTTACCFSIAAFATRTSGTAVPKRCCSVRFGRRLWTSWLISVAVPTAWDG